MWNRAEQLFESERIMETTMMTVTYYPLQALPHIEDVTKCVQMGVHLVDSGVAEELIMHPPEDVVGKL